MIPSPQGCQVDALSAARVHHSPRPPSFRHIRKRKSDCFRVLLRGVMRCWIRSSDERWRLCMSTPGVANPRARPRFLRVESPQFFVSQLRRLLCTSQSRAHFLPRPWLSCREGSADPSSRPAPAARGQLASQPSGRWIAQPPRHQEFNRRDVTAVLSCRSKTKMSEIRHKTFFTRGRSF